MTGHVQKQASEIMQENKKAPSQTNVDNVDMVNSTKDQFKKMRIDAPTPTNVDNINGMNSTKDQFKKMRIEQPIIKQTSRKQDKCKGSYL